ncbi:hypothetical protein AB0I81_00560 [Nonomuraea sp. NPDC050404]
MRPPCVDGFTDITAVLTREELSQMSDAHRRVADMDAEALNHRPSRTVSH